MSWKKIMKNNLFVYHQLTIKHTICTVYNIQYEAVIVWHNYNPRSARNNIKKIQYGKFIQPQNGLMYYNGVVGDTNIFLW